MTNDAKINYELQKPVGLQIRHGEQVITKKKKEEEEGRAIVRPNVD
jgi:hypothetical protein